MEIIASKTVPHNTHVVIIMAVGYYYDVINKVVIHNNNICNLIKVHEEFDRYKSLRYIQDISSFFKSKVN